MKMLTRKTPLASWIFAGLSLTPLAANAETTFNQIVLSGDTALGTADQAVYESFAAPELNNAGDVAFRATLRTGIRDGIVDDTNDTGYFGPTAGNGSPIGVVVREGTNVPGENGATFKHFDHFNEFGNTRFSLNSAGQMAMVTDVDGLGIQQGNDRWLFGHDTGAADGLDFITGDGLPQGDLGSVEIFFERRVALNDAGAIVFPARLEGDGIDINNDHAILWKPSANAPLQTLVREGDKAGLETGTRFGSSLDVKAHGAGARRVCDELEGRQRRRC